MTGIEVGPDYCVLVVAQRRHDGVELTAARVLGRAEWAVDHRARTDRLRSIRSALGLPRDCAVVVWDGADARPDSPLSALSEAGFRIRRVTSPAGALSALARVTPRPAGSNPAAWLVLNTNGAAIAVVKDRSVLYSRTFAWTIDAPENRRHAELLRQYLRVAQIVPELRRAIQSVRASDRATVDTAIACGNLPGLRSLTMPIIRDTDVELETLDSAAGLELGQRTQALDEIAPAIRLALAVALAPVEEDERRGFGRVAAGLAAAAIVAIVGWWTYAHWSRPAPAPSDAVSDTSGAVVALGSGPGEAAEIASSRGAAPADPPVRGPVAGSAADPPDPPRVNDRPGPGGAAPTSGSVATGGEAPAASAATRKPVARPGRLPSVEGVLIAPRIRLAVVDGVIVGEGDAVGTRRVSRIDTGAVTFRDSTGRDVRIPVRPKSGGL
jgi:hypothetical protein